MQYQLLIFIIFCSSGFTLTGAANSIPITVSLPTSPVSLSSLPSLLNTRPASPPRPSTPGLGIPMEMTPGQIMEAEISATLLDNPSSPFQTGSLTTVLTNESDQVCASLPENVFSVSSPGPSCPGLDSDFDQVIHSDQVINNDQVIHTDQVISNDQVIDTDQSIHNDHQVICTSTQVHTSLQQSSQQSDLPSDPIQPAQTPHDNTRNNKRRRSGRSEPSHLESKKIRLNNCSENVQLILSPGMPESSTNVHQI